MSELILEINENHANDAKEQTGGGFKGGIIMTPSPMVVQGLKDKIAKNETYWLYRVKLYKDQAVIAFAKFMTIGIGFAIEEDWNTNLPYSGTAEDIFQHIKKNKFYKEIKNKDCIKAIELIQARIKTNVVFESAT